MEHKPHKLPATLTWRAPEHIYRKKTWVWYAAIGLFFLACIAGFFILKSWLAALTIIIAFWLFLSYAEEKPKIIDYKIDRTGVTIGDKTISYGEIHSFVVEASQGTPLLYIDTTYPFSLPMPIVVKQVDLDDVVALLLEHIPMRQEFSLIRWLNHLLHY